MSIEKLDLKNKFKYMEQQHKVLTCSNCDEFLYLVDIQHYSMCPYCDAPLHMDEELEEYILKPVIEHWAHSYSHSLSRKSRDEIMGNMTI